MPRIARMGEQGITFLASLFELMILVIFLPLIVLFFIFMMSFFEETEAGLLEWQLFTVDLQSYLTEIDAIEIINNGSGVRIMKQEVEYDIEMYGQLMRKQKFNQGHEIMATNIKNCNFQLRGSHLFLRAEFTNGSTEEAEYVFTLPKEQ